MLRVSNLIFQFPRRRIASKRRDIHCSQFSSSAEKSFPSFAYFAFHRDFFLLRFPDRYLENYYPRYVRVTKYWRRCSKIFNDLSRPGGKKEKRRKEKKSRIMEGKCVRTRFEVVVIIASVSGCLRIRTKIHCQVKGRNEVFSVRFQPIHSSRSRTDA